MVLLGGGMFTFTFGVERVFLGCVLKLVFCVCVKILGFVGWSRSCFGVFVWAFAFCLRSCGCFVD